MYESYEKTVSFCFLMQSYDGWAYQPKKINEKPETYSDKGLNERQNSEEAVFSVALNSY